MLRLQTTLALVATAAHAIIVTPGSPCSSSCGNVLDSTNPDDLVCGQDQYSSSNGQVFQSCVDCELSSTYSRSGQSDTQMMLYNMRYVTSYCLFGYPENQNAISTPCITSKACGPFQDAIQFNNLTTEITNYDYCAAWPVTDFQDFDGCKECLRAGEQYYLANFVAVLQAGCEQQPVAGRPLSVEGELFSMDHVNGTTASTDDLIDPSWFDQGPLDMGARVGIAIGGIVFILSILGFCVVWRGKRKRRAYLRTLEAKYANQNWPSPGSQAEMFETPVSQQALRGWNDSPLTSTTERTYPRYFSPYSSQFNSPVSAQDGPLMQWPAAVQGPPKVIGVALGGQETHDNWLSPIGDDKGKSRVVETYELHEVQSVESDEPEPRASRQQQAPVLHHPGYGRTSSSPPRQYAPN